MGPEASSPEEGDPGWSISSIYQSAVFLGVLTWILFLLWRHLKPKGLTEKIESELLHKLSQQILKSCSICEKLLPFHSHQQCKCCSTPVCTECCIEQDCPKCYLEKSTSSLLQSSKFQSDLKQKLKVTLASLGVTNGGGGSGEGKGRDAEVRELMEKLVESLVEEDLDNTPITPVTTHPSYKSVPHLESTETVQAQLKSLIVQVLREANSLPSIQLNTAHQKSGNAENLKSKSYEDILATTILNKIVEKSQLTKQEPTSSESTNNTEGRRNSQTKKSIKATCEFKLGPDGHTKQTVFTSRDGGDVEEVHEWSTGSGRTSLLCTTVEHIEEVITRYTPNEYEIEESEQCASSIKQPIQSEVSKTLSGVQYNEGVHHRAPCPELGRDIVDGSALLEENRFNSDEEFNIGIEFINDLESWQENWLFQKKKLSRSHSSRSSVHHPVPVPMLVPCPGPDQTCRTLIGDVDAEETSDLSECSDSMYDDPIFKTSSPKAASSKPRSGSKSRRSNNSLKVVGSSSSDEDEDNTEDGWIEAKNKDLLLSTSPVDSGEGSLEMLSEEESSLPLSETRRDKTSMRPVPKPRKSATKSNSKVDNKINQSKPNTSGSKPNNTISNEPANSKNSQSKTKITTQTFLENERNAPSNVKNKHEIKTNGVIPKQTKELPEDLTTNDGKHGNSQLHTKTSKQNRNGDSKPVSDSEFVRENTTNQRTNDTIDEKNNNLNSKYKETNKEVKESKEINNNTSKPSKTSETDIQNIEKQSNKTFTDKQIDKTTKTEVKDLNTITNTKNNTKDDQNPIRNHTENVYQHKEVDKQTNKPEETDDKYNKNHSNQKSTVNKKDNTKSYSKDNIIVDKSKQVELENIHKSIKNEEHVPEEIVEKFNNGENLTNIKMDKCNIINGDTINCERERRNSKETNGTVYQSNKDINGDFNQSTNEGANLEINGQTNQSNNGLIKEEEQIAKESYDREQEAEMREIEILNTPPKPGTIAEREHAKWLSAVPMENNPYSKENIEKRNRQKLFDISRSTSSDQTESNEETDHSRPESIIVTSSSSPDLIKRYSRDYYINNSLGNTPSHISTSNTSLSSLGGGKPVAHPIKLIASSTPKTRPQPKQRSKELDDLKRPANVSSDEDEYFLGDHDHDVNSDVNNVYTDKKIEHDVVNIEGNVEEDDKHQNIVGRNVNMENQHEQFEHKVGTDPSQSDANENNDNYDFGIDEHIGIHEHGIQDKNDTGRNGKDSKSEKVKPVEIISTTNGNKNQTYVTKEDNTESDEISNSSGKNSHRGIERSASQTDLQKMPVEKTDPKYASVQTLPNMKTNEKPKKKKKSLFSSIRNFLTNKKAKSISKCESSSLLFVDKSLQNIYSDTWNQRQADQMKRETFDDELLETFRKSKMKQIESFILNEQTVKGSEENNFDYLKNMNEEDEKKTGKVDENTPNIDNRNEEKSELNESNKTAPISLDISSDMLEMQCEKEARIIISTAMNEITVLDNHFEANDQSNIDNRNNDGNERKSNIQNTIPIISITDMEEVLTIDEKPPKGAHNSNASTLERQYTAKSTRETDKTSPNNNTKNGFDNIETITTPESNKSNTSTLERQRNANSVPIQVVHEQTEHPCGDIIVHVDSERTFEDFEDIQNNYNTFKKDIDYAETSQNNDIHYKDILDISEDTRTHFIKEIDKIFEQEGLNITFEHNNSTDSLNETCEEYYSNKPNETNISPKVTLDKTLLKIKQEEIHAKIMKRHLLACKNQSLDIKYGNVCDESNDLEYLDNNMENAEHSIVMDNELNDIKDKIAEKFDVQNITMQKTIHVSTALHSDNVEEHDIEAESSVENSIPVDMNLEEYVLRNSLRHKVLKPKSSVASANFSVNPLFSNEEDGEKTTTDNLSRSTNHNGQETAENGERNTSLEANDSSFLSDEFSFHARKTPESGYSSNVEIFSRINTPELMENIPETMGGIHEFGSREYLGDTECQIPCMENLETDKLKMNTAEKQIVSQLNNLENENNHNSTFDHNIIEAKENSSEGNNFEDKNQNNIGIPNEQPFVNHMETFIRNERIHSEFLKTDSEEFVIQTNVLPILNEDLHHKPSVSIENSQLLEPGIILDDRIIRERRNVILNNTTAKPDEPTIAKSEKTHIEAQKSESEAHKVSTEVHKSQSEAHKTQSEAHKSQTEGHKAQTETPKSVIEENKVVPDLNGQLNEEFHKLQRVFSNSLENLDDIESEKIGINRNDTENIVENRNSKIPNESFKSSDENKNEKVDDTNDTLDNSKQLYSNGRNTLNFNTRL